MALTFLIDTSVVKRLGNAEVRQQPLAVAGELARARITDLEVGYSARNEIEWDGLMAALEVFEPLESTESHHRRALQVQRLLAQRSQRGRKIPDLLVAAAAEEHGLIVLHYDADFDLISSVTGQPCQWVAPGQHCLGGNAGNGGTGSAAKVQLATHRTRGAVGSGTLAGD